MILEFCKWLAQTPLSILFQSVSWVVPSVQTVHILCVAIVVTRCAMLDLRLIKGSRGGATVAQATRDAMPWIWGALAVLAATGTVLIIAEPARELTNAAFWLKMSLLVVGIALAALVQRGIGQREDFWDMQAGSRLAARCIGAVSLLLWVSVLSAGRWIGYVQHG